MASEEKAIIEGQAAHLAWLAFLLITVGIAAGRLDTSGSWLGVSTNVWLAVAIVVPILHQVYVTVVWRLELHSNAISSRFGMEHGFTMYAVGFSAWMSLRVLSALAVAIANSGTLPISSELAYSISAVMAAPVVYLLYSIMRHFGYRRAMGMDHFDDAYRDAPLVKEGIFRYIPNAMYTVGFLTLWIFAISFRSQSALVAAAFSHAYIWVHYFCTEKPDMRRIYG